ncbi:MAG: GNAT family N-acyltransferase [Balneolaceae bacterium]|nr:GNAT family N-acyltransferase [Balneolaceae bacterium]
MPDRLKNSDVIQGLPRDIISNNKYLVRFAHNEAELEAAQKLRFKVFNLELGEGLESSYERQLDADEYDEQCHHLLVVTKDNEQVIGTYRLQTHEMANSGHGFYTGTEFDLSSLPPELMERSVEVGRACIDREHRNGRVLYLLWRGLARYMEQTGSRYLFGCCSLTSQSDTEAWTVMDYLRESGHLHPEIRVEVKPEYRCEQVEVDPHAWKKVKLPQLFRLYKDLGSTVCSPPAKDRQFKTIDYLVILDIESLDERTRMLFFT